LSFEPFQLHPHLEASVRDAGYRVPTPIQERAIPPVMEGHDVLGLAQTGTGKTAAFALPILHRLLGGPCRRTRALVVAPTRELAQQIHETFVELGQRTPLRSVPIYGGVGIHPQIQVLRTGIEVVVACPGRLLDHLNRGTADLAGVETVVLDEADRMFDMGFLPEIRRIFKHLPRRRQTLLFSATMPDDIRRLTREVLTDPVTVQIDRAAAATTVAHALYPVAQHLKTGLLLEMLGHTDTESVLVFTRTKHRAKRVAQQLERGGYRATSLQGNLSQNRRQAALDGFRDGTFQVLVATDIAARGIDVSRISHVINYDMPDTVDAYTHRIGRTGRAARTGDAFTLVTREDEILVRAIERALGAKLERRTLAEFDYSVAAPKRDTEFARPPRQPRGPGKRARPAAAAGGERSGGGQGSAPSAPSSAAPSTRRGTRRFRPRNRAA
jgi:ATP-dependent RNA helicase RhlE